MKDNLFYSTIKMKKYFKKLKKVNPNATLLGLDVGRIYVGSALSDRNLTMTSPHYTYILKSGTDLQYYPISTDQFNLNLQFFYELDKLIKDKKVKGLIIGYPLQNNEPTKHAKFIESFIKHICREQIINIPLTFINEEFSTFQASKFLEFYQASQGNFDNKNFSKNKKLQDKVAASIILQRFLDIYNKEELEEDKRLEMLDENDTQNISPVIKH